MRAGVVVGLLCVAGTAAAQEPRWSVDLAGSLVVLGDEVTTGGFMPTLSASRSWPVSERWAVGAGAEVGVFGFGDEARWIGVLGGPTVRVEVKPSSWPVILGFGLHGSIGRIPTCNNWGLCLQFIGLYPGGELSVRVDGDHLRAGGSITVRYVNTLAWTGASVEPSAYVGVAW